MDERIGTGTLADQVAVNAKHLRDAINTALEVSGITLRVDGGGRAADD